jgi:uncharacterized protein YqhQ
VSLWRQFGRAALCAHTLPALQAEQEALVGGQAVIEGVMMRTPHAWGIAVRKQSGEIATHSEPLERPSEKRPWTGLPFIRGVVLLGQAMSIGFRALRYSANVALEEEQQIEAAKKGEVPKPGEPPDKKAEITGWMMAVNVLISLGFFIFLYKFVPLVATTWLQGRVPALEGVVMFNLIDGAIRIALFITFIWSISLWNDIRRVYQYHGAEHKTVFAFENRDPLTVEAAQKYGTLHPRCGTSFLMTVLILAIGFYTLIPVTSFGPRFAVRVLLLPVIAAVAYEIIRFAARRRGRMTIDASGRRTWQGQFSLFTLLTTPGLWMQRITTKQPTDDMVECAIRALEEALEVEKARGGELVLA